MKVVTMSAMEVALPATTLAAAVLDGLLQHRSARRVGPEQAAGHGPGDAVPDVVAARPAADLDGVGLAGGADELGDLVAVVPRARVADLRAVLVEDLQVEIDGEHRGDGKLDAEDREHRDLAVPGQRHLDLARPQEEARQGDVVEEGRAAIAADVARAQGADVPAAARAGGVARAALAGDVGGLQRIGG